MSTDLIIHLTEINMLKRISLFLIVNILVIATISIVTSALGLGHYVTAHGLQYGSLLAFCAVWGVLGSFISLALSRWMAKFAMGITPIDPANCSEQEKILYNRVAQLATQAGIQKTPEVGVYQSEDLNAFATGPSKNRSLVAVSTGLLNRMNKNEIDGVLAHEISHIANGDMVTMALIQGVVNAFVMFLSRVIGFFSTQFVKEDIRPVVNMIVVIVLDILFSILGSIVIARFSRWREFRADEGGARLSGKGNMIAALAALKAVYDAPKNEEQDQKAPASIAAFQISNKGGFLSLFSTHPPLEDRIKALQDNKTIL
jgi:heat shock protein HtpX